MKIVLTGAASCLAQALLPALCERDDVDTVIGIDWRPCGFRHPKFQPVLADIRDTSRIAPHFAGVDSVIHLAFIVLRSRLGRERHDRALVRDINVRGTQQVFHCAAEAGARRIVHLSSAAVYGAWPDNPALIDETWPRRSIPHFSYAQDKNAVEDWLDRVEQTLPCTIRLRPHAILGPHCQPFLRRLLAQPCYPRFADPQPQTQCVWEGDVVQAIVSSLQRDAPASYNLAADGTLSFADMIALRHRFRVPLPFTATRFFHRQLWRVSGVGEEPGWLAAMRHSLTVSSEKAKRELGWTPTHDVTRCVLAI